jgi:hypothetical protein
VSRINVLTAIRDHDQQGAENFLDSLGFERRDDEILVERGRRYDARALLAYAHGKATGDFLDPERLPVGTAKVLTDLGFTVASRDELERPKPATRTTTPRPRAGRSRAPAKPAKAEPVVKLCPTCFTQLSVTGTCDFCD